MHAYIHTYTYIHTQSHTICIYTHTHRDSLFACLSSPFGFVHLYNLLQAQLGIQLATRVVEEKAASPGLYPHLILCLFHRHTQQSTDHVGQCASCWYYPTASLRSSRRCGRATGCTPSSGRPLRLDKVSLSLSLSISLSLTLHTLFL